MYLSMLNYIETIFDAEDMPQINDLSLEITGVDYLYELTATFDNKKQVEITYFTGSTAAIKLSEVELEQLKEVYENDVLRILVSVKTQIIDPLGSLVLENPLIRGIQHKKQHDQQKADAKWEEELQDALTAVRRLRMEFAIVEGDSSERDKRYRNVDLYPVTYTYELLERWMEVHEINSDIPYPEEEIQNEDWEEIGVFLYVSQLEMNEYGRELYRYISDGKLPITQTVEDVATGKK